MFHLIIFLFCIFSSYYYDFDFEFEFNLNFGFQGAGQWKQEIVETKSGLKFETSFFTIDVTKAFRIHRRNLLMCKK